MMKHFLAALAISLCGSLSLSAQNCTPSASDYNDLANRKTLVVLDDDMFSDFNLIMKDGIKKENWPTEVAFCKRSEFLTTKRKDSKYAFIVTTTVTYPDDKTKTKYTYLSLLMGKDVKQVTNMPDLISIPLAYARISDQEGWAYKLPAFVRFIMAHVQTMKADSSLISDTPLLRYNNVSKSLKSKILYLVADDLDKSLRSEAAIKKVYPYAFKLVSRDDVKKAIDERDSDVVFLHKVGPEDNSTKTRCFKMIMSADNAELYYFSHHKISSKEPDGLLAADLKDMSKK